MVKVMRNGIFPTRSDHRYGSHFHGKMPQAFSSFMVVALNGIMLFISILTQESEVSIFSALQKQAALSDQY